MKPCRASYSGPTMIFDLVKDYADALAAMPTDHPRHRILKLLEEAIRRDVHFIDRHPTTMFQCMWNTCWWYDCEEAAVRCPTTGGHSRVGIQAAVSSSVLMEFSKSTGLR